MAFHDYGLNSRDWLPETTQLHVELFYIKKGGYYNVGGVRFGKGLLHHYVAAKRLIWPRLDEHRWATLCFEKMVENKSCVLMGCASSGKTHTAAVFSLIYYFSSPDDTCVLVSSTQMQSLKKRIWSEITTLWEEAVARHDFLPGNLLDSAIAITTDSLEDSEYGERTSRDMRRGVFGVACVQGGKFVGLSRYMGIKQKHMLLVADEMSAMTSSFLSAVSNLNANENFKFVGAGNPNDLHDPLGKIAEPVGGWSEEFLEPKKTTFWKTRFFNGVCVNLVGYDSPNFDFPEDQPTRYRYLISKEKIAEVLSFFTEDSVEHYSMSKGVMKIGTMARRILSRAMCIQFGALEEAVWDGSKDTVKVYFVDAAYGGDRCVGGYGEFGKEVSGKIVLRIDIPKIIPIKVGADTEPEAQIAAFVRSDCESKGIPPENMGHDATGKGGLGTALAREWSANTHPIEAGGSPTDRPVSLDLFIFDEKFKIRRLKTCKEHYDRLASETNFQVRYAVESGQIRNLPEEALEEFQARRWDIIAGDKRSVESKSRPAKQGTQSFKDRLGRSPDISDWVCGLVEMARRKGFQIEKIGIEKAATKPQNNWLTTAASAAAKLKKSRVLQSI